MLRIYFHNLSREGRQETGLLLIDVCQIFSNESVGGTYCHAYVFIFIEMKFKQHKINHFKLKNSVALSPLTVFYLI